MIRHRLLFVLTLLLLLIPLPWPVAAEQYNYIDISNPFLRKTPMAVPMFKAAAHDPTAMAAAKAASELLVYYLDFTGYFTFSDPAAFLEDPQKMDITGSGIRYRNWTAIGAELLVTGGVVIRDGDAEFELRLFDTVKEKMMVGKRYRGSSDDLRQVARRFCSEVVFAITGSRGFFDSKIAFISNGSGHKEIYLCEFDGSNISRFTRHNSISLFPDWSSDGRWIAYTTYADKGPKIRIQHVREKRASWINKPGLQAAPSWVPGRFELAASLSFSGDQEIYLLTGNGKIIKRLTSSVGIDVEPTWSPDGKRMAFVSKRSGNPQIYIYDTFTGRVQRLTFEGRYNTQPNWSPKGDRIAYSALRNGVIDIFTINPDGGEPIQLTENQGSNEAPAWSPDGSLIAFSSTRGGKSRIYVMTAYGTDQRRLLTLPGEQTNPKWSPNILNP
ncbi:MAG: Tol-Pal system beta propeller repeat protein TolB [Desulfosarcina sp.]|nr:Tol-Pal system beta propeller repeat protein TolB [Desulfosarcina sp.]MBC2743999.1 Tol-Pal system beta propeller repeat protein TolB [Desulfosarcina sp.]MBC2766909.1 Tol-Pal system beta propeller repeat protein TolB [Desulfosarcina sp.]